jgi:FkbM family methyltransferase
MGKRILLYFIHLLPITCKTLLLRRRNKSSQYYALNEIDQKLKKYLLQPHIVKFYVELGANDGITQSNTLHFEMFHNFTGILIEPVSELYKSLKLNRGKNNKLFNFVCVEMDFPFPFIKLTYSNLMTKAHLVKPGGQKTENQIALEADLHAFAGEKFLRQKDKVKTILGHTITLNEILIRSSAPMLMGLLSLDVEGAELNVLMGINHEIFKFQYMLVETDDFAEINKYLDEKGYNFIEKLSGHDYLFAS